MKPVLIKYTALAVRYGSSEFSPSVNLMYTFSLLYITIALVSWLCQKPFHSVSCCGTARSNLKPVLLLSLSSASVCMLILCRSPHSACNTEWWDEKVYCLDAHQKKLSFSHNLILEDHLIFRRLLPLPDTQKRETTVSGEAC